MTIKPIANSAPTRRVSPNAHATYQSGQTGKFFGGSLGGGALKVRVTCSAVGIAKSTASRLRRSL